MTYAECIPDPRADLTEDTTDYTEQYVNTFGAFLTPKQRDVFALMVDGYGGRVIADKLNTSEGAVRSRKDDMRKTFAHKLFDTLSALESYDIYAVNIANREPPKRFYKTSEKQREAVNRYLAKKRARKLAEKNGNDVA